jgi:hypothetical protein
MVKLQDGASALGVVGMALCPLTAAAALTLAGLGVLAPAWMWISMVLLVAGLVGYAFDYRCHRQIAPLMLFASAGLLLWAGRYTPLGGTGWEGWPLWGSGSLLALGAFGLNVRARSLSCVVRPAKPAATS